MKKRWLCFATAVTLLLSGCTYTGRNVDSLLHPPMLSDEQKDIIKALKKDNPEENIKLVYPQRGENRSAILLTDLDDEPTEEALVFLQPSATSSNTLIGIRVLDKSAGKWSLVSELQLDGMQIEDVSILDVGTGTPLLAVGLNYTGDGNHLLQVMEFKNKKLNTVFSKNYQVKDYCDLNEDGKDDIFIVENAESEVKTWARAYCYEENEFLNMGEVNVNPEITRYVSITRGNTTKATKALYLDGYKGTELMSTEILSYQNGKLVNLTYDGVIPQKYPVDRAPVVTCWDLTNDGIIEVPGVRPLPGYEEAENREDILYLTDWYHFTDTQYELKNSSYVNTSLNYLLTFPQNWVGKVSARKTSAENEMMFYEYSLEKTPKETVLLYLRVATRSDWISKKIPDGYELIDIEGQIVYLAKVTDTDSSLKMTITQVKEYFSRIA